MLVRLAGEHRRHQAAYERLAALVAGLSVHTLTPAQLAELHADVTELADVYRAHIRTEEDELFPEARAALAPEAVAEMAAEMETRRPDKGRHHGKS